MSRLAWNVVVFVAGFVTCTVAIRWVDSTPPSGSPLLASFAASSVPRQPDSSPIADIAERDSRVVVSIQALPLSTAGETSPEVSAGSTVGSGILVNPSGFVVTNHHVIENAKRLRVQLWDGSEREGALVGSDYYSDLAVLKIPGRGLPAAELGDDRQARVGDPVLAIGNPLGFSQSVSLGIISAVRRGPLRVGGRLLSEVLQTDAAINQGSSGGGLFDRTGRLIGINAAIVSRPPGGGSIGIAFAIPIHIARPVIRSLIARGWVPRPWIGVRYRTAHVSSLPLLLTPRREGVLVEEVVPDSPAALAGILPGDLLVCLGDQPVRAPEDMFTFVGHHQPGEEVNAVVRRGQTQQVQIPLRLGWAPGPDVGLDTG